MRRRIAQLTAASADHLVLSSSAPNQRQEPKNVRLTPQISGHFVRHRRSKPDSAKSYGNPVRGTTCRNTDGFPVSARASLIGRFVALAENV